MPFSFVLAGASLEYGYLNFTFTSASHYLKKSRIAFGEECTASVMTKSISRVAGAVTATALSLMLAFTSAQARIVVDHDDRQVNVPDQVNRVVTADILPFASVTTVFLGGADKIVGIHPVSMSAAKNGLLSQIYPDILKANTSFMKGSSLNIEALLALKPDVVFVNAGNKPVIKQLENAGIAAIAVSPSKWDYNVLTTYDKWIELLGEVFPDKAKGDKAAAYSKSVAKMIAERTAKIPDAEREKVLFVFQYDAKRLVTSGKHFFGQYWCDAVGAKNAAESIEADNQNAQISMEQVYKWNPDIVMVTNFTPVLPADIYANKYNDWSKVKAVQDKKVYKLPLGIYRSYTPSADTPVTLLWMAKTVYPKLFADIDLNAEVKKYYHELYGISLTDEQVEFMYKPQANRASGFSQSGK